jgi:hypothetical protein
MKKGAPDLAEAQFEAYLEERGISGGSDRHPDLGGDKNPDYRISRGPSVAIVELKGIETSRMHDRLTSSTGTTMLSGNDIYGSARNTINKARRQLRPYANRGEPLVIAVANPRKLLTPTGDARETIAVLHGNPAFVLPISKSSGRLRTVLLRLRGRGSEAVPEGKSLCGEDGVFGGGLHRYVSAVITLHERTCAQDAADRWHQENGHRWDRITDRRERGVAYLEARDEALVTAEAESDSYRFVRVFETLSAAEGIDAVPVPRDLFDGPCDEFWTVNLATGKFERAY